MIFSPLEQFSISPLFIFSNLTAYLLIIGISFIFFTCNLFLLEKHIGFFIFSMKNFENQIFILILIFNLIFFSNIIGMIPYSNTVTAQFAIVFSISIPIFININILGLKLHKHNLLYLFLPSGVPVFLIPFITFLEVFSYFIRVLSITIRLAANLIAGHILIKILLYNIIGNFIFFPLLIPIILLELFVAGVQAYVFFLLLISYYNDILYPH